MNVYFIGMILSFCVYLIIGFLISRKVKNDNDYYVAEKDGTVTSSLTSDENRMFLSWLHQLWEEGLLDRNGFTNTDSLRQITDEKRRSRTD